VAGKQRALVAAQPVLPAGARRRCQAGGRRAGGSQQPWGPAATGSTVGADEPSRCTVPPRRPLESDITWASQPAKGGRCLEPPIPCQLTRVGGGLARLCRDKGHKGAESGQEDECLASHGCSCCWGTGRGAGDGQGMYHQARENGEMVASKPRLRTFECAPAGCQTR
jgi:hypothetical protein